MRIGFERIVHKINLNSIENNIDYIQKCTESLKIVDHLRKTLEFKVQYARDKLLSLYPHRSKRALINALGSAIKYIAGNPDSDDLEIINQNLGMLERQENLISKSLAKQTIINEQIQIKINNITDTLKKINKQIISQSNNSLIVKTDLEYINLIMNIDLLVQILNNIEEQIEFAKLNILNRNLLSYEDKIYIFNRLKAQKLKVDYPDQIFQYSTGSVIIKGTDILILAKIPILEDNEFDLINIQTLNINNTRISTDIKLVAKHGDIIYKQTQLCDICDETTLIDDECIHGLLNHLTPRCVLKPARQPIRIVEIKRGIVLIDTNKNVLISDSCNGSRLINTPTIIETNNCTIKVMNYTFNNQNHPTTQEEYLIPIYGKRLTQLNLTAENNDFTHIKLDNLDKLQEIKLDLHHTKRTTAIWGGTLLIITIVCSFVTYIINRKTRAKQRTTLEIQHPTETTLEIQHPTETTNKESQKGAIGSLPSLILFGRSPEDGRQSERGGVTPRPTNCTASTNIISNNNPDSVATARVATPRRPTPHRSTTTTDAP